MLVPECWRPKTMLHAPRPLVAITQECGMASIIHRPNKANPSANSIGGVVAGTHVLIGGNRDLVSADPAK
jgi:hypothetical protein